MKKLVLETTSPFQGLAELVAYDEGLFAKEGVQVEWADRDEAGIKTADTRSRMSKAPIRSAATARCSSRARPTCTMPANGATTAAPARTSVGSRQVGRRAIVTYAAIVVRPDSPVYTPQQLAGRTVGVPFYAGTHYLALHLLEGFLPRDQINVCRAPNGSRNRFNLMMKGEIEATTLTEPYITLAEKKGCRVICSAFFHGTEVASDRVDAETYAAFNRAVKRGGAAHQRQQEGVSPLLHRLSQGERPGDRHAQAGGPPRGPHRAGRSGADPGRRDAAHLRVGEELGHAGGRPSRRCSS